MGPCCAGKHDCHIQGCGKCRLSSRNCVRRGDVHAIRNLQADARVPSMVQLIEGGTLGLDLLPALQGVMYLLTLDAVDTGNPPGTVTRFVNAGLDGLPVAKSIHLLGFADLLNSLRLLEQSPAKVVSLGVQPKSTVGTNLIRRCSGGLGLISGSCLGPAL